MWKEEIKDRRIKMGRGQEEKQKVKQKKLKDKKMERYNPAHF